MRSARARDRVGSLVGVVLLGLVAVAAPPDAAAQLQQQRVLHFQKISTTEGGFTGDIEHHDNFGAAVANLGDLDGDGNLDVAVGSGRDDDGFIQAGAVFILFLNADGTVRDHQKISATSGGFTGPLDAVIGFGNSLAGLGDLDGDDVPDLAVGVWNDEDPFPAGSGSERGSVFILFLNTDGTVKAHQKISSSEGNLGAVLEVSGWFGDGIGAIGDLDGDGVQDLAVGAPGVDGLGNNHGAIYVLFLNTDGTVKAHQKIGETDGGFGGVLSSTAEFGDEFGRSVVGIGDLDGDGVTELAVGAPQDNDDGPFTNTGRRGAVWILFMNTDGTVKGEQKISMDAGNFKGFVGYRDWFGRSVAGIDDWDGDGVPDLAVGSQFDADGGGDRGAVFMLFLNPDGTVKSQRKISNTPHGFFPPLANGHKGDNFGRSVAYLGDMNGDGFGDIIVGAELDEETSNINDDIGAAWLIFPGHSRMVLGDKIEGTVAPGDNHLFAFDATAGTRLDVKVVRRQGEMHPQMRLYDPTGAEVPDVSFQNKSKKVARIKRLDLEHTGTYLLEILDELGTIGGEYKFRGRGRYPRKVKEIIAVGDATEEPLVTMTAVSDTQLRVLSVKSIKPKGDFAALPNGAAADLKPAILSIESPELGPLELRDLKTNNKQTAVTTKKLDLPATGDYVVEVGGLDGSVGYATVIARLKPPRSKVTHIVP